MLGLLSLTLSVQPAAAQQLAPGQPVDPALLSWPRFYATNGFEFAVYQPQISSWPGNHIHGRFVVAVRPAGTTNESYGVVFFQARTDIDKVNRLVTLEDFAITRLEFPTQRAQQERYRDMLLSFRGHAVKVIPLDHLESVFAASADVTRAKVQAVKNEPPRVIFSTQPSLLILVDGPPVVKELTGDFERVINTRAILLRDKNRHSQTWYLRADNQWFAAPALAGPWTVASNLPTGIDRALDAALATKAVDPLQPRNPDAPAVTQIYVSTVPAELLETAGAPNLLSIAGTDLLYVGNTSNALFYYLDNGNYYVLISGRWFKSGDLHGPWAFVPPGSLPGDFKKIPADSEKSNVLMSVPGTPQAQEAVIANAIPQTATIEREQAKLEVAYSGAPSFVPIAGTTLCYAANTPTPVIMVAPKSYYACQGGVWFVSTNPLGPWTVATSVPSAIYTIPPGCPIHYVTYVYVYGYTPAVVYVGYTPGYMGTVVAPGGVVVYGTGYYYPPVVVGTMWVSYPPTYGYGASFALGAAVGFAFGYCAGSSSSCCCEPYWGCYHWATPYGFGYAHCNVNACNYYTHWGTAVHATGCYGYNPYTGNEWASRSATTFNPYTGTRGVVGGSATYNPYTGNAAASRGGSWYNPYSGASASASASGNYNTQSGKYSGNRQASGYNPRTGASFSGSSSISGSTASGNINASRQASANNPTTGRYASGQAAVSGNVYNGTASVSRSGTAGNTQTGNSVSWDNGSLSADRNGNIYSYNRSTGTQAYNASTGTWGAAGRSSGSSPYSYNQSAWGNRSYSGQSAWSGQSTWGGKAAEQQASWSGRSAATTSAWNRGGWAEQQRSAQSLGAQRFDNWSRSGGGGWGGFRRGGGWRR